MSRPLRIAFLLGSFPVVSETFILRQITGLLDLGHDVRIFANARPEESVPIHPEVAKYNLLSRTTYVHGPADSVIWELPVWPLGGQTWSPGATSSIANWRRVAAALPTLARCLCHAPGLTRQLLNPYEYRYQAASWSGIYRLGTLCRQSEGFDVLHAHFGPVGNSFRFARTLWRAPLVVSFHGYDVSTIPKTSGAVVYRRLFAEADAVTGNSNFMRAKLQELGCPTQKVHKLPYGINVSGFPFREREREGGGRLRVLTIARLTEKKGIEFAIRAVAKVRQIHPEVALDVIGDGPLGSQLRTLIEELGQSEAVTLHGAKNGDAVREMLGQAHIFMLPSVTASDGDQEGTPVSVLEAQAAGLPVISTRHAGIPEIVLSGQSGFLVTERDFAALADRLTYLIEHPERWLEMGRQGRAFVEAHFTDQHCTRVLLQIYDEVLEKWARNPSGFPVVDLPQKDSQ